jgi:hypothetical protein
VSEEKNLTPRDNMKIYDAEDSECVTKGTTETNMQDVPSAVVIVSAGRHYTHQSLTKVCRVAFSALVACRVS